MSDEPLYKKHWPECKKKLEQRLQDGYAEYGDYSFERSPETLFREVEEEILDQMLWSFIAWTRVRKLREEYLKAAS
jgi:hypothetical protein